MSEIERFQAWMDKNGVTMKSLALQMSISYLSVYTILIQRRNLTSNFKWRFTQVFGWEVASQLFDQPESTPSTVLELA